MKCKNCDREIDPAFIFCPWCGTDQLKRRKKTLETKVPKARQLPSGNWFIQLSVDGERYSITKPTEKECVAEARAIKDGIIQGRKKLPPLTLSQAIDDFIAARDNSLSPETRRTYRRYQKRWENTLMKRQVRELTQEQLQSHYNAQVGKYSPKTLRSDCSFICGMIERVTGQRYEITLPTKLPPKHKYLLPEEIKKFCAAVKGTDIEIASLLALSSMRRSELCALDWSNVDLARRTITVSGAVVFDEHNKKVYKETNKNEGSARIVPIMMDQLYDALLAVEDKTGPVVLKAPNTLSRNVHEVCDSIGITSVSLHPLRHSYASLAAHLGMPKSVAMAIGGWENDKIMDEIYTHVYRSDIEYHKNAMADFYNIA